MTGIFTSHECCKQPLIVLIEGEPGMGKTTYSQKLVFDWAIRVLTRGRGFKGTIKKPFKHPSTLCYLRGFRGNSTNQQDAALRGDCSFYFETL